MSRKVLIINGHPDARPERLCAALARAYAKGAARAGCEVRRIDVGVLDIPFLSSREDFEKGEPAAHLRRAQEDIVWAEHLVVIFPLWLGAAPAKLKAFLEQVFRARFTFADGGPGHAKLKGRSARVFVTMGMPAFFFRLVFKAHGLLGLENGLLRVAGFGPVRHCIFGGVEGRQDRAKAFLARAEALGERIL